MIGFSIAGLVIAAAGTGYGIYKGNEAQEKSEANMKKSMTMATESAEKAGKNNVLKALQQYAAGATETKHLTNLAEANLEKVEDEKLSGKERGYKIAQQVAKDISEGKKSYGNGNPVA